MTRNAFQVVWAHVRWNRSERAFSLLMGTVFDAPVPTFEMQQFLGRQFGSARQEKCDARVLGLLARVGSLYEHSGSVSKKETDLLGAHIEGIAYGLKVFAHHLQFRRLRAAANFLLQPCGPATPAASAPYFADRGHRASVPAWRNPDRRNVLEGLVKVSEGLEGGYSKY